MVLREEMGFTTGWRICPAVRKICRRIARIARMHADLLLLDEPTSHLDTYSQMAFGAGSWPGIRERF